MTYYVRYANCEDIKRP